MFCHGTLTGRQAERLKAKFLRAQKRGRVRILDLPLRVRLRMLVNRIKTRLIVACFRRFR